MTQEAFGQKIRALLPEASSGAMEHWLQYANELENDKIKPKSDFFDSVYVELSLIKYHYNIETAAALVNYAEHFVFNPFELRKAANLMRNGWPLNKIADYTVEYDCDPTAEEYKESKAILKAFQDNGEDPIDYLEKQAQLQSQFSMT